MKRQQDIQKILEEFKGVPGIKSAKKKVFITKKTTKAKASHLEKELPILWRILQKTLRGQRVR